MVVDPLVASLGERVRATSDQQVRRALTPLAALAERTGAAVRAVRHLTKSRTTRAKYRDACSIGIIGAVRSALLLARDPDDPNRRVIAPNGERLLARCRVISSLTAPMALYQRAQTGYV